VYIYIYKTHTKCYDVSYTSLSGSASGGADDLVASNWRVAEMETVEYSILPL